MMTRGLEGEMNQVTRRLAIGMDWMLCVMRLGREAWKVVGGMGPALAPAKAKGVVEEPST